MPRGSGLPGHLVSKDLSRRPTCRRVSYTPLLEPLACLLAARVHRDVHLGLSRTEEFLFARGCPGGTIDIAANADNGTLRIRIENPADPDRPQPRGESIGLQNARGRLAAISNGRASLRTEEAAGKYRVDIELPS